MLWWSIAAPAGAPHPTVIASELTLRSLDALMLTAFGPEDVRKSAPQQITVPQAGTCVALTPAISLRAIPMQHNEFAPVLGVRFEADGHAFAFTGDTMPTDAVVALARDADLLVHDSTYSATLNPESAQGMYGHSTAQTAARNARAANAKHLALIHLDAMYQGKEQTFLEEARREYAGRVSIPTAGTLFTF
jgi:ribonuclease BN (tRNA processing enzyme)